VGMVAMLTDKLVIALDMSVMASSRQLAAWKTRAKEALNQGVRIKGERRGWVGNVVKLCSGIVVAASLLSVVVVGSGIVVVGKVIVIAPLTWIDVGVVVDGVRSLSGRGVVFLVGGGLQYAGYSLQGGETTKWKSAIAVVVIVGGVIAVWLSWLLGGREGFGNTKLSHILQMSSWS